MQRRSIIVCLSVVTISFIVYLLASHSSPSNSPSSLGTSVQTTLPTTVPPVAVHRDIHVEDITIHPYDLVKNSFLNKGHVVRLDVGSYPFLLDGNFLDYRSYDGAPGTVGDQFVGVRFEKMLDPETALFEVLGYQQGGDLSNDSSYGGMGRLGQLVVLIPSASPPLDSQVLWNVEPLGIFEGSNAFGASVSAPLVRFCGYWQPPQQPAETLRGPAKAAVDLVRSRIHPTDYLSSMKPSFHESEWETASNDSACDECWYVTYHIRVLNSGSTLIDFVNPGWQVNLGTKTVRVEQKYSGNTPVADDGSTSKLFTIAN